MLTRLVIAQDKRIPNNTAEEIVKIDSFKLIRNLIKNKAFVIAKNKKQYTKSPQHYDGLLHKDLLCLRSENLLRKLKKMGYSNTLKDIRNSLIKHEALWLDSEGKNKKIGDLRFIGIYKDKLK